MSLLSLWYVELTTCILSKTGSGASDTTAPAAVATCAIFSRKLLERLSKKLDTPEDKQKIIDCFHAYNKKYHAYMRTAKTQDIDLIPKWWPITYSFVCMLLSPLRLVNMYKKQKNFEVKTRRRGLINMQTKE